MINKESIISDLYQSSDIAAVLKKMRPENLRDDLRQELFIVLCEMPETNLIEIANKNQLKFYALRIMFNLIQSKTSRFYYKYRKNITESLSFGTNFIADDIFDENEHSKKMDVILSEIDGMNWYERDLFNLYLEKKCNASELCRITGIPKRSILHTIKSIKDKIKQKVTL